jgi:release factor glutamine methyltransferase
MKVPTNNISDLFAHYRNSLSIMYGTSEAKSMLYILLEHYFNLNKLDIAKDPDIRFSESEMLKLHFGVKGLLKSKPIQYITGRTEFCGLEFVLNEYVLIPRPETEELVQMIVSHLSDFNANIHILDIGTGSGCIPISVKKSLSDSIVYGVDISEEALNVATKNALVHNVEICFKLLNILDVSSSVELPNFDVIISNPPYIRESEKKMMNKNVLDYEPELALFVSDDDPLLFYKAIAEFGKAFLNNNGFIYLEINEYLGKEMQKMLFGYGYSNIQLSKDFKGKDRFVRAQLIK